MWEKLLKKTRAYFEGLDTPASAESRGFLWLWSLSFYLNYAEEWTYPILTFVILGVCVATFFIKNLNLAWGLYLAFSTAVLAYKFPILANHSIFNLFVNFYLLYLLTRKKLHVIDSSASKSILLSLAVVYFMAGIHKLNEDYMYSSVSCALSFMDRISKTYFGGALPFEITRNPIVPWATVALEILIAVFLIKRKTFYIGLSLAVVFHMLLAALEFIDFSMNSLSILVLALGAMAASRKGAFKKILDWLPYFVIAQFIAGLVSFFEGTRGKGTWGYHLQTLFFVSFSLWVLYQGFKVSYESRKSIDKKRSYSVFVFPSLIFIFAAFNYLGLSTAGTFSMFSNLRTEGESWNHLFIPKFLRIFDYQDRIYWVDKMPKGLRRANREHPREKHGMPEIEFYRTLEFWKKENINPPFFEYTFEGKKFKSDKITSENLFEGRNYSWLEQKIFFFRRIQRYNEPNKCKW